VRKKEDTQLLADFFSNGIFFTVISAWVISQLLKFLLGIIVEHKVSLERLIGGGGMPSGHSATVVTLTILVGYYYGYSSALFAITAVLAVIVMYDATGVRRETGKQAVFIKEFASFFNDLGAYFGAKGREIKTEKLKVLVGHTPFQVVCGALVGIVVSIAYILLWGEGYAVYSLSIL
jgi:acid phosphatase family membrane protein YuiD